MAGWAETVRAAVAAYNEEYRAYFERNNARVGGIKRMLDPRDLFNPGRLLPPE
ncbi:hypothetical protein D3C85_1941180 [compost metagenome]